MARDLFATLDLNLLKTLLVLGQEQNMRRAAERLFVTQPAVSQALKKLRHHFDDELFIRTPGGMQATSFTERLLADLAPLMDELSSTLNEQREFDPASIQRTLRIALTPQIASSLAAPLFMAIRQAAPGATVEITNWNDHSLDDLAKGELNLGVNMEIGQTPQEIALNKLAELRFTVYVRQGHALAGARDSIDLQELDGCEMATLVVPDWNDRVPLAEQIMNAHGYSVRRGFRSDMPAAITQVIRETDMVYPANSFAKAQDMEGLQPLIVMLREQDMTMPILAYFHQKNRRNPLTLWLRDRVGEFLS